MRFRFHQRETFKIFPKSIIFISATKFLTVEFMAIFASVQNWSSRQKFDCLKTECICSDTLSSFWSNDWCLQVWFEDEVIDESHHDTFLVNVIGGYNSCFILEDVDGMTIMTSWKQFSYRWKFDYFANLCLHGHLTFEDFKM